MEAIDRLSRLEAVDGLQDVLLALVWAGVSIVTLEDGAEYSRATLREDGSKLIILAVKAQAAWEYSRRLSKRITAAWKQAEVDLGKRPLTSTASPKTPMAPHSATGLNSRSTIHQHFKACISSRHTSPMHDETNFKS